MAGGKTLMLDIQFIRDNPEKVKDGIKAKGYDAGLVDKVLSLDEQRRTLLHEVETLRAERNKAAKEKDIEKGKLIKAQLQKKEPELESIEKEYQNVLYSIPNLSLDGVPEGREANNKVLRKVGNVPQIEKPRDHLEIGEALNIIDVVRAAKVSGARFAFLKNEGVLLEFALVRYAIDVLMREGFVPVIPPVLIKKDLTQGLGYWQGGGNENYYLVNDYDAESGTTEKENPLYLVGTGEHVIVPMHKDEILEANELPKKYAAFSPCFRREAGTYGKDTRGILRVHQFDKVEMVQFVKPEDDEKERRKMLELVEGFMQSLGLPYQVVKLASGDTSFPTGETIDIETWIPSQDKYRETHSISTTTDFQARRLNIRYKTGSGNQYVHILNGTAFAIGRMIVAILENFQQEDGTIIIPEVLQKYTGFSEIRPK